MGNYVTTTSISTLIPNYLSGNTTTSDAEGTAIFSKAITRAEDEINSLLGARFATPFSSGSVPPAVITWAEDRSCYYALRAAYAQDGQIKQVYVDAFNQSTAMIEKVAAGEAALKMSDGSDAPVVTTSRYRSSTLNYTPIFGRDDAADWKRDSDEVTDTEDARG